MTGIMKSIFSPENFFFRTLARCVDIVGLSLLWLLLCFPVVTIGPATAALYHSVCRVFRFHEDEGAFGLFFRSLKANLKQGILATLILIPFAVLLFFLYYIYSAAVLAEVSGATIAIVYFLLLLIIPIGLVCWLFPLLGRFHFPLPDLFLTAFRLMIAHIPTTLLAVALAVGLFLVSSYWLILSFVSPALWAAVAAWPLERAFSKHMTFPESGEEEDS